MTSTTRRFSRAAVCCALLVFSPILLVSSTTERPCDALRRWAAPYHGTSPTLDDLVRFDRPHRLAIFNAITPEARAAIWREQLDRFSRSPHLSDAQRVLVREGLTHTTPALYAGDKAAARALAAFWQRAGGAFGREHRAAWFTLGGVSAATTSTQEFCQCSSAWGWLECESMACPSAGCEEWLGCGLNGNAVCNGYCAPVAQ